MAVFAGQTIGAYQILEQLGRGRLSVVHRAYDTHLERDVAVKFIRPEVISPANLNPFCIRFDQEAKAVIKLSHPNIAEVYDNGRYEGMPYLVMEYLSGGSLKDKIGRPIPHLEAARILAPIAHALDYAHQQGIIHRDIKPSNILFTKNGIPKLCDLNIIKVFGIEEANPLVGVDKGIGSAEYLSPEQWQGKVVPVSDIYSLGVVFFEMVTGRKPYIADTAADIQFKVATDTLPRPRAFISSLPTRVEQVIYMALAKSPRGRCASASEFAQLLDDLSVEEKSPPASALPTAQPTSAESSNLPNSSLESQTAGKTAVPTGSLTSNPPQVSLPGMSLTQKIQSAQKEVAGENAASRANATTNLRDQLTKQEDKPVTPHRSTAPYVNRSKYLSSPGVNSWWYVGLAGVVVLIALFLGGLLLFAPEKSTTDKTSTSQAQSALQKSQTALADPIPLPSFTFSPSPSDTEAIPTTTPTLVRTATQTSTPTPTLFQTPTPVPTETPVLKIEKFLILAQPGAYNTTNTWDNDEFHATNIFLPSTTITSFKIGLQVNYQYNADLFLRIYASKEDTKPLLEVPCSYVDKQYTCTIDSSVENSAEILKSRGTIIHYYQLVDRVSGNTLIEFYIRLIHVTPATSTPTPVPTRPPTRPPTPKQPTPTSQPGGKVIGTVTNGALGLVNRKVVLSGPKSYSTKSGENGTYLFTNVVPGEYDVYAYNATGGVCGVNHVTVVANKTIYGGDFKSCD